MTARGMHRKLNIMMALSSMGIGGSQTYTLTLAVELKRRGHNVVVASRGGQLVEELTQCGIKHQAVYMPIYGSPSPQPVQHHNRYVLSVLATEMKTPYRMPHKLYRLLAGMAQVINLIRKEKIDIIHSSQPGPTLVAYLASQLTRVPFMITVHGTLRNEFPPIGLRFVRKGFGRIIAVSDEIKEHLINNYETDTTRVSVIYNGIDLRKFSPQPSKGAVATGNAGSLRRVAHIMGWAGPLKSAVEAVPIIAQMVPNVEMVILGPSAEFAQLSMLAREVNRQLARESVRAMGNTKDVVKIISSSEVVIGVGRCALEAMACGKPVVLAGQRKGPFGGSFGGIISQDNISETKKYNFSGRNGSEVTSAAKIAEAVVRLLKDEKHRRELGAWGRRIVEDEFDIEKIAEEIENIYLEVLEER